MAPIPPLLILASASPARARMLADAGLRFDVVVADIDEAAIKARCSATRMTAERAAERLATAKAEAVTGLRPKAGWIIGADQLLICEDRWFDKAVDRVTAADVLARLQGRTHRLISAVSVLSNGRPAFTHTASAAMTMQPLSDRDIERYLDLAGDPVLASVGCYQLEGLGVRLFERIDGDCFTILGLPLLPLLRYLRDAGAID